MDVNMAAQKKKKQKTTYYQVTPQATTEQQLRIQKMRDELNAPDPNDPHVFTRYKNHLSLCGAVSALCTIPYLVQKIRIQPAGKIRANGGLCTHPVLLYCVPSELALKKHFSNFTQ